ncbi:MAG: FAD-dependent thymidylate synthase [Proteobacteria bacterium]|nr:FAD-dependent thymidylate synthase [Pseudomonadota bacterium]
MSKAIEQIAEIQSLRNCKRETVRPCVSGLEDILHKPIPVLDHGFVRVVDYMGDDSSIVQAARVSYGTGTKKVSQDRGLIRYLLRHRHTTPFEMCEIKFHVKLPIFVARQWIRHRTANVNEYSARYSILDKEFYVPDSEYLRLSLRRSSEEKKIQKDEKLGQKDMFGASQEELRLQELAAQSTKNKQGREGVLSAKEAEESMKLIKTESQRADTNYRKLLNEDLRGNVIDSDKQGLARELARMVLPVNYYTQWYWKIDLYNLLHFLSLRADSHAQYEIRVYAQKMSEIVESWVPLTYEAFRDYRMGGANLSAKGLEVVKRLIGGEDVGQEESGLPKREWRELMETLGR